MINRHTAKAMCTLKTEISSFQEIFLAFFTKLTKFSTLHTNLIDVFYLLFTDINYVLKLQEFK